MTELKLRALLTKLGLRPVGRNADGWLILHCPFARVSHKRGTDRNPSFMVRANPSGASGFNCFSCKAHGSLPGLVRQLEDVTGEEYSDEYMQAVLDECPESFGEFDDLSWEAEAPPVPLKVSQFVGMFDAAWEAKDSRRYLCGRGIGERTTLTLDLRYDPDERRILFPVYGKDCTELYGFTGRSIDPGVKAKVKNYAGLRKEWRLLGEHLIEPPRPLLVVEGLFGLASLVEAGAREVCNPVAIMGSALSPHQRDLVVGHDLPTYLCFDDDLAGDIGLYGRIVNGRHNERGALAMLEKEVPTYVVRFPSGVEDVDDLTLQHVRKIIFSAA